MTAIAQSAANGAAMAGATERPLATTGQGDPAPVKSSLRPGGIGSPAIAAALIYARR